MSARLRIDSPDPDRVRLEADYILACQYIRKGDPASGAINDLFGAPTWVVPRENALAILGLVRASEYLSNTSYRTRAQAAMRYLLRVQDADGGWFDQYNYATPFLRSKSPTQTAEVMIALNKLGFQKGRYRAMVQAAEFLVRLQDPANKTGQDDGLIAAGLNDQGQYQTWRWTSDNAFGYQGLKAAARWARLMRDRTRQQRYEDAAARILDGINTVLKDPASPVWYAAVDAQGNSVSSQHEWINYAPQMVDVPAEGVGDPAVGNWIHQTLVHQPEGAAVWNDGVQSHRLSPGYSFQACLVWLDLGQHAYCQAARQWADSSDLHQVTPDANGIAGGWIDWLETTGGQAQWWERFIDTSFYDIVSATEGFDFSAEPQSV
jgi:hypothetical protein